MPSQVIAHGDRVYVLEGPLRRVAALSLNDGTLKWAVGRAGAGPDEFKGISSLTVDASGQLLILDAGNGRIAVISPDGVIQRHILLSETGFPHGICAFPDGQILLSILNADYPLALVSTEGRLIRRLQLPWGDARRMNSLSVQGRFAAEPERGGCIYGLTLGRGFVRITPGEQPVGYRYVEEIELPSTELHRKDRDRSERLGPRTEALRGLAVDAGGIAAGFVGTSEDAGRIIDQYDPRSGEYVSTLRAPFWFERMTRLGTTYVFITRRDGYPMVVAAELVPAGS